MKKAAFLLLLLAAAAVTYFIYINNKILNNLTPTPESPTVQEETRKKSHPLHAAELTGEAFRTIRSVAANTEIRKRHLDAAGFQTIFEGEKLAGTWDLFTVSFQPAKAPLSDAMKAKGYEKSFGNFIIFSETEDGTIPIMWISPNRIADGNGDPLVDQVPADFGYAFKSFTTDADGAYKEPARVFMIVMLDENGDAASDELTIYWKPSEKAWRATNTFGAPGTF